MRSPPSLLSFFLLPLLRLGDALISLTRHSRYIFLLPLTPLLELGTSLFFKHFLSISINPPGAKSPTTSHHILRIKNKRTYARVLAWGHLGVFETYKEGWWEVGGDLRGFMGHALSLPLIHTILRLYRYTPYHWECLWRWQLWDRSDSEEKLMYNLPEAFYKEFPGIGESCGYYGLPSSNSTLEEVQLAIKNQIGSVLGLRKGMRVLDIGCGFASLAKHLAKEWGVVVVGVESSPVVAALSRALCGPGSGVTIQECDWREVGGQFDAICCIEMSEHVGRANLKEFYRKLHSLLKNGRKSHVLSSSLDKTLSIDGRLLVQMTTMDAGLYFMEEFCYQHMYGSVYFPTLVDWLGVAVGGGSSFEVLDLQNLRGDFVTQIGDVVGMIGGNYGKMERMLGAERARMVHIMYVVFEAGLRHGFIGEYQVVFRKCGETRPVWVERIHD